MHRVMAGIVFIGFSIACSGSAFSADNTRAQHRNWMRKLDTPGGTLPESLQAILSREESEARVPDGTTAQHRSWIRKLQISHQTSGTAL
ncbi:hypothetical protein [Microvirga sp. TS319]|uniref:hypothetical protein n=1 Tax=Microvirga sp. TS319 TaxID=3241165 RepID=UPI00351A84E5